MKLFFLLFTLSSLSLFADPLDTLPMETIPSEIIPLRSGTHCEFPALKINPPVHRYEDLALKMGHKKTLALVENRKKPNPEPLSSPLKAYQEAQRAIDTKDNLPLLQRTPPNYTHGVFIAGADPETKKLYIVGVISNPPLIRLEDVRKVVADEFDQSIGLRWDKIKFYPGSPWGAVDKPSKFSLEISMP